MNNKQKAYGIFKEAVKLWREGKDWETYVNTEYQKNGLDHSYLVQESEEQLHFMQYDDDEGDYEFVTFARKEV